MATKKDAMRIMRECLELTGRTKKSNQEFNKSNKHNAEFLNRLEDALRPQLSVFADIVSAYRDNHIQLPLGDLARRLVCELRSLQLPEGDDSIDSSQYVFHSQQAIIERVLPPIGKSSVSTECVRILQKPLSAAGCNTQNEDNKDDADEEPDPEELIATMAGEDDDNNDQDKESVELFNDDKDYYDYDDDDDDDDGVADDAAEDAVSLDDSGLVRKSVSTEAIRIALKTKRLRKRSTPSSTPGSAKTASPKDTAVTRPPQPRRAQLQAPMPVDLNEAESAVSLPQNHPGEEQFSNSAGIRLSKSFSLSPAVANNFSDDEFDDFDLGSPQFEPGAPLPGDAVSKMSRLRMLQQEQKQQQQQYSKEFPKSVENFSAYEGLEIEDGRQLQGAKNESESQSSKLKDEKTEKEANRKVKEAEEELEQEAERQKNKADKEAERQKRQEELEAEQKKKDAECERRRAEKEAELEEKQRKESELAAVKRQEKINDREKRSTEREAERKRKESELKAEMEKEAKRKREEAELKSEREKEAERNRKEAELKAERKRKEAELEAEREKEAERKRKEAELEAERKRKEAELEAKRKKQETERKRKEAELEAKRKKQETERKRKEAELEAKHKRKEAERKKEAELEAKREKEAERKRKQTELEAECKEKETDRKRKGKEANLAPVRQQKAAKRAKTESITLAKKRQASNCDAPFLGMRRRKHKVDLDAEDSSESSSEEDSEDNEELPVDDNDRAFSEPESDRVRPPTPQPLTNKSQQLGSRQGRLSEHPLSPTFQPGSNAAQQQASVEKMQHELPVGEFAELDRLVRERGRRLFDDCEDESANEQYNDEAKSPMLAVEPDFDKPEILEKAKPVLPASTNSSKSKEHQRKSTDETELAAAAAAVAEPASRRPAQQQPSVKKLQDELSVGEFAELDRLVRERGRRLFDNEDDENASCADEQANDEAKSVTANVEPDVNKLEEAESVLPASKKTAKSKQRQQKPTDEIISAPAAAEPSSRRPARRAAAQRAAANLSLMSMSQAIDKFNSGLNDGRGVSAAVAAAAVDEDKEPQRQPPCHPTSTVTFSRKSANNQPQPKPEEKADPNQSDSPVWRFDDDDDDNQKASARRKFFSTTFADRRRSEAERLLTAKERFGYKLYHLNRPANPSFNSVLKPTHNLTDPVMSKSDQQARKRKKAPKNLSATVGEPTGRNWGELYAEDDETVAIGNRKSVRSNKPGQQAKKQQTTSITGRSKAKQFKDFLMQPLDSEEADEDDLNRRILMNIESDSSQSDADDKPNRRQIAKKAKTDKIGLSGASLPMPDAGVLFRMVRFRRKLANLLDRLSAEYPQVAEAIGRIEQGQIRSVEDVRL